MTSQLAGWRPHVKNIGLAGVRYRCLTPLRILQARGVSVELFDPSRRSRYSMVIVQGLSCLDQKHGDWATGAAFIEEVKNLKAAGTRILVDDCDNHFYNPLNLHAWSAAATRLRELLNLADHVVASTAEVARVFQSNAVITGPISVIGDAVESDENLVPENWLRDAIVWRRWRSRLQARQFLRQLHATKTSGVTACVWFGSHGSSYADGGMLDLLRIRDRLEAAALKYPLTLTVISNSRSKFERHIADWSIPTSYMDWNRLTFAALMRAHQLALIPISPSAFTVCKTNNRLITALNYDLAVIADRIPSYEPFRGCVVLNDWAAGLEHYLASPDRRAESVHKGRVLIARHWTEAVLAKQWENLIRQYI